MPEPDGKLSGALEVDESFFGRRKFGHQTLEYVISIERYESNLREVLENARSLTDRIALLASPPVIEGKPNQNSKNRLNGDI